MWEKLEMAYFVHWMQFSQENKTATWWNETVDNILGPHISLGLQSQKQRYCFQASTLNFIDWSLMERDVSYLRQKWLDLSCSYYLALGGKDC